MKNNKFLFTIFNTVLHSHFIMQIQWGSNTFNTFIINNYNAI